MRSPAPLAAIGAALLCGVGAAAFTGGRMLVQTMAGTRPASVTALALQTREVPLIADVTNSGGLKLGSYSVTIDWDSTVVRIDSVTSGTYTAPSVNYVNGGELRLAAAKPTGGSSTVDTLAQLWVHFQNKTVGSQTTIVSTFDNLTASDFTNLLPQLAPLSTVAQIAVPVIPVFFSPDTVAAVAGDTPSLDLTADLTQAAPGTALGSFTAKVTWDSTVLALDSAAAVDFTSPQFNHQDGGTLLLSGASANGAAGTPIIARLYFRFVNTTYPAQSFVNPTVSEMHAATSFADLLPGVQLTSALVSVGAVLHGDIDASGAVDALDAQLILQGTVGLPLPQGVNGLPNGDANCDGILGALDAQIVLNYVVGNPTAQFCVATFQ